MSVESGVLEQVGSTTLFRTFRPRSSSAVGGNALELASAWESGRCPRVKTIPVHGALSAPVRLPTGRSGRCSRGAPRDTSWSTKVSTERRQNG